MPIGYVHTCRCICHTIGGRCGVGACCADAGTRWPEWEEQSDPIGRICLALVKIGMEGLVTIKLKNDGEVTGRLNHIGLSHTDEPYIVIDEGSRISISMLKDVADVLPVE